MATYVGNTIYDVIINNRIEDGTHTFTLQSGTSQNINNVAVKNFYGDFTYSGQSASFDDITASDTFMCVRIFHGNLTISSGQTFDTPQRTRGFFVFVKGNLTNNGTISMTAKGANAAAPSADLQIWGTATIPRQGQAGRTSETIASGLGNAAVKGNVPTVTKPVRGTGGGGSAGGRRAGNTTAATITTGAGSQGTIWSGGNGGGGAFGINGNATGASATSSAGGAAVLNCVTSPGASTTLVVGGGAGITGGNGRTITATTGAGTSVTTPPAKGTDGAGGLLLVACLGTLTNNNVIESKGSKGGEGNTSSSCGGSSGGGSVNLISRQQTGNGSLSVAGGEATNITFTSGLDANGGAGGDGSSTIDTFTTLPRRTLIKSGTKLYYRNFTIASWLEAGDEGSTAPFEQFGMLDGEVLALDRAMIAGVPSISLSNVTIQTYVPS